MSQLLCLGKGRPGFRAIKICLRTQSRQTCTLLNSLVRLYHHLAVQMSKAAGLDYYLYAAGRNLVYQDQSARCCKPLPLLSHNEIPSGQALQISLQPL